MHARADELKDFLLIKLFLSHQCIFEKLEGSSMLFQKFDRGSICTSQGLSDFMIDDFLSLFAELPLLVDLAPEERIAVGKLVGNRAEFATHAPMGNHPPRQ